MSADLFFNAASGRVVDGGTTAPTAGTVETWVVEHPERFVDAYGNTAATGARQFSVVDVADRQLPPEVILVTNATSQGVWTVTRGAEGTHPVAHHPKFTVKAVHTSRADTDVANGARSGGGLLSDATTTAKGIVQLAGDLAGTAGAPTVPGLAGKAAKAANLADLTDPAAARTNLGLGSAATQGTGAFDAAGAATAAAAASVPLTQKGAPSGVASLDSLGKLNVSELPALSITNTYVVGSQAAMLNLGLAHTGDVAVRTDLAETFILQGTDPSVLSNWVLLPVPAAPVTSVNGKTGNAVLNATDVGADPVGAAASAQAASQPHDADLDTIAGLDSSVAGALVTDGTGWFRKTYAQLKSAIGLGNVDNTADTAKPVSTAQQAALDGKQAHDTDLDAIAALDSATAGALVTDGAGWIRKTYAQLKTALGLVKADVGLANVDNTSDANKPVSTAQQTALDLKAPLASPALTGNPTAPTQTAGNSSTRLATTAYTDAAVATQHTTDNATYAPLVDPSLRVTTLNDNFTRANGALGSDPQSGYVWAASGGGPPTITSNAMVATGTFPQTSYGQVALLRAPVTMSGTLSFVAGGGTDASPAPTVLASSSVNYSATPAWYLIHVQYTRTGYQIQKAINGVFTTIASGTWTTPVPVDGTQKTVSWSLYDANGNLSPTGTTLKLTGPNGESVSVTDADLGWLNGRYCFWSLEPQDANSPKSRWHLAKAVELRPANPLYGPQPKDLWIPDQGVAECFPRHFALNSNLNPLASGTIYCTAITLPGGVPINWLEWFTSSTAGATLTHCWAVILDTAGRVLAASADNTAATWAANTGRRFWLADVVSAYASAATGGVKQFVPPGPMTVWAGLCVVGGTMPTLNGTPAAQSGVQNFNPRVVGASTSGHTTPPTAGPIDGTPGVTASGLPYVAAG